MSIANEKYTPRLDVIAFVIIALSFAVRYWFVDSGQLNLVQDEAQYWDWIRRPQLSYYSKGPLIAWVITTWCQVFGSTELGVRFGAIIGMTGIQAALYIGISRVWREYRLAVYALLIAATLPLLNGLGILMTTDNPLIFCWTVAFFALSAATRNKPDYTPGNLPFIIMGVCIAVGILAKYMMIAFLGLGTFYALVLHFRGQLPERFWGRYLIASLAGTIVGLLPIIIWNMQNDWVGFKHVAKLSTGKDKPFTIRFLPFLEMLGAQIGLLAPWWFPFIICGGWRSVKKSVIGPIGAFDEKYRHLLQAALFFWPLWLAITFWSLKARTEANWTAVSFMGAAIVGGIALMRWWEKPHRTNRGRALLAGTAILFTAVVFVSPVIPLPDNLNITHRLKGWDSLGQEMHRLAQTEFENSKQVFLFSDKYDITSELAFYTPGQPITYCLWTNDRRMNQYDIWPGPGAEQKGWGAIMVRKRHQNSQAPKLARELFEYVSPPIHFTGTFNGEPARKFTIHICKGYKGEWLFEESGRY
ncbi:Dolichyl-phosphate-mannose-protein mannosyltransferase family protein [Pseudodesulfovibrio profundus]|uniref:Dolichyl-phosphate-mannose-protein mannosyltransferase family protein n=1 Tax=Pseudodesulfovibrio profundus TaxID=57320 RepID=A0A2C8F8A8_9BACT|nr:glycosyltransferase family 39 protein [Pseudodesulfovibrio profundus]SOB58751.1 Dolichyl-phosphate-mannose-protein mannosyltransferase family protein [Pseudodesulfovibrio profundus]